MMIWGNMIDASRAARENKGEDAPSLVPKTWELVKQDSSGSSEVLARGVLAFDLCESSLVYSNGSAIFRLDAGGSPQRLFVGSLIEQIIAAGSSIHST
jgi:hypothetical protein